ncbi:hypothetical protein E4T56_gene11592 [Termitomyces sp. T112]|nr:hypothetical protein E4T56_gene11592 [Termitomyces sp. T112]
MASSLSTNSLHLDVVIEMTDTQQIYGVMALLNSGATGLFLDSEFVKCHGPTTQPLSKPILVYNIDGMPNKAGAINSMVDLVLHYWNHVEHTVFAVTSLGRQDMILGFTWLLEHNSEVNWTKGESHAGPLLFADLDLLDPPPLAFPHREALYEDNQSNSRAPEEEHREEFGGIYKPELPDKVVEVGDQIYATTVHPLPSIAEIW